MLYTCVCDSPSVRLFRPDRTGLASAAISCFKLFKLCQLLLTGTMSSAELKNTEYDVLLTINAETFQRLSNIHEEAQKEHKFARFTVDLITVDEWHRDTDSVSSDKGADQPAEEVKAASEVRFIVVSNLDHHLAQQLADESQAGSEEEPAASKTQSESDVGSRNRARAESEVGSECSESIARKVGKLGLTVPTFPPSTPGFMGSYRATNTYQYSIQFCGPS